MLRTKPYEPIFDLGFTIYERLVVPGFIGRFGEILSLERDRSYADSEG